MTALEALLAAGLLASMAWTLGERRKNDKLRACMNDRLGGAMRAWHEQHAGLKERVRLVEKRLPPDEVTAVDSVRTAHARIQGLERRVHGAERLAAEAKGATTALTEAVGNIRRGVLAMKNGKEAGDE